MTTITGTIEKIEHFISPEKIVISLRPDAHELLFIEFRGSRATKVIPHKENDLVSVKVAYEGRISKAGVRFNNIVGRNIQRQITEEYLSI